MLVSDFDFHLPEELIAQEPLTDRSASRLLHLLRGTGAFTDRQFRDFPALLRRDDLLVVNNSRVFPARLFGRRSGKRAQPLSQRNPAAKDFLQGEVEVLLTQQVARDEWQALVRPGGKIGIGEKIYFFSPDRAEATSQEETPALTAEVIGRGEYGERTLRFAPWMISLARWKSLAMCRLPPYIAREDRREDRERYQTVYARPEARGSVAAPTAGLHFTPEILARIREHGIEIAEITLHVGLGTFQPVHAEQVEEHKLHTERFYIPEHVAATINAALREERRIVAVGTTTGANPGVCGVKE